MWTLPWSTGVRPGDIVVTQDYGLASMCLARRARVLNQNGLEYTADNIDVLLERRWQNKKLLRAGKHPKGPAKRTKEQDEAFAKALEGLLYLSSGSCLIVYKNHTEQVPICNS